MSFTLTGGTVTAGAQQTPNRPPAVHAHTPASHTSPTPVETAAPAPADEHSEHPVKPGPADTAPAQAPAEGHPDHATTKTAETPADERNRGLVLGGFAALNASILLAAAGVRRRHPKRQRRARANADG